MSSTSLTRALVSSQMLWFTVRDAGRDRLAAARRTDAGLTTLEIVIWGLGLFLAAGAAVGVITGVIQDRTSKIK